MFEVHYQPCRFSMFKELFKGWQRSDFAFKLSQLETQKEVVMRQYIVVPYIIVFLL